MKWPVVGLSEALASAEVFVDGDWVESKDQDPEGDVRLVQLADVGDGEYIDKSDRFLTSAKARELRCTYLQPGDVMLARMPDPLGRACIFPGDPKPSVTVVDVCIIRPDNRQHDARWLMHCLNAPACRNQIAGYATGTTRSRISRGNLGKIKIPLPPLAEQRRIAEVLDRAEALRAKRSAALAQLDSLTQSLFLDLFGDPATNPKGWPVRQLQEVVRKGTIVTYGIVQAGEEFPGGVPYIRTGDIVDGEIVTTGLRHTDPAIAAKFRRSRVEAGDIVMSIRATVGTTALVPPELDGANLTQGTGRIAPGDNTDRLYLLNFLRAAGTQHWISLQIKGATFREITLARLRELPVAVPPIELQREFGRRVRAVEKLKTAQRESLAELNTLFASLQHRAFRGEL